MSTDSIHHVLAASGLIDGIDGWESLNVQHRVIQAGDTLCKVGDLADSLWVICEGQVAVRENGVTIVCRGKGEVVGEQGLLASGARRTADLIASEQRLEVLRISRLAIDAHASSASIWRNIAAIVSRKLTQATSGRSILHAQLRDAEEKLRVYVGEDALGEGRLAHAGMISEHRRRRAVVWFSDVVGFSKFATEMPSERVVELVRDFLTAQVDAIVANGGYIDKYIGDAIMAYWIIDSSSSTAECIQALDAAERAIAMVGKITIALEPLSVRIGMHLGDVHCGDFGTSFRRQYTLIGDTVNRAARLEQATKDAGLGSIRVSDQFYDALPEAAQHRLPIVHEVSAKNVGSMTVHSSAS